ncbi:hypothetical protein DL771_000775 [Monosporascus sp. 5C6A]|nr:hypothetical protein DL771_000775 [Monosporascus sp. 5C6A]
MAWDHLAITAPHLAYVILGGFTSLFMLCSSVIKERMYIGEATVATICGVIFGPTAANLINPISWGNVDTVTLEFSRIVLVVQCFAIGVELPKFYMERHWKSVAFLLIPVMTFGWLIVSLFIWWMVPALNWLESLAVAACVTATDPVLASSVVGKGKFAKRVPKHLRDLLSAESGCNDGMAFPFVYLAIYLLQEHLHAKETVYHWFVYTILYECIFGAIYGFAIGYIARHGIKGAEKHDLIDRESFLVFYFTLALFCAGSGSLLGLDDLLVGFAAGVGFSNDGWFSEKTEESHVSNVIDLLLNLTYFVYLGTIIPWDQFNNAELGLSAWRLSVMAILVIFFRRIPIMLALKPWMPDVKTWREALFAGHFGPIGVGAIFVAILCRAELETGHTIPLAQLPDPSTEYYNVIALVWPIVTFMVIASIIVHGSSVAVFTLGKRINTLSLTMSYTTSPEDGPSWMNRLPRISSQSKSQARSMSDTENDELKMPELPPGTLPPTGLPGQFLRRQREEDNPSRAGSRASSVNRRRRKRWDDGIGPGGHVSQSAIFPQRRSTSEPIEPVSPAEGEALQEQSRASARHQAKVESEKAAEAEHGAAADEPGPRGQGPSPEINIYDEGNNVVVEDQDGQVLAVEPKDRGLGAPDEQEIKERAKCETQKPYWTYDSIKKSFAEWRREEQEKRKARGKYERKHEPARAYQFGNTIIVEDEDGEVVKRYEIPEDESRDYVATGLKYMGMGSLVKPMKNPPGTEEKDRGETQAGPSRPSAKSTFSGWAGFGKGGTGEQKKKGGPAPQETEEDDDRQIRFTIGGVGRRMTKDDFLKEVRKLDPKTRRDVVDHSTASAAVKSEAKELQGAKSSPQTSARDSPSSQPVPATEPAQSASSSSKSSEPQEPSPPVTRGRSSTTTSTDQKEGGPSTETPETGAERRRRLAAFASVREDTEERETPAERRRREAALGGPAAGESDSDDDNTERVPVALRRPGIRFADDSATSRRRR